MVAVECWPAAMAASDVQLVEVVGDASHLQMIVTANVMDLRWAGAMSAADL